VPDVPEFVKWQIARQDYIIDVMIRGAEDIVLIEEEIEKEQAQMFADSGEIVFGDGEQVHDSLPPSFAGPNSPKSPKQTKTAG
jgi:hypothetical protein